MPCRGLHLAPTTRLPCPLSLNANGPISAWRTPILSCLDGPGDAVHVGRVRGSLQAGSAAAAALMPPPPEPGPQPWQPSSAPAPLVAGVDESPLPGSVWEINSFYKRGTARRRAGARLPPRRQPHPPSLWPAAHVSMPLLPPYLSRIFMAAAGVGLAVGRFGFGFGPTPQPAAARSRRPSCRPADRHQPAR